MRGTNLTDDDSILMPVSVQKTFRVRLVTAEHRIIGILGPSSPPQAYSVPPARLALSNSCVARRPISFCRATKKRESVHSEES